MFCTGNENPRNEKARIEINAAIEKARRGLGTIAQNITAKESDAKIKSSMATAIAATDPHGKPLNPKSKDIRNCPTTLHITK